MTDKHDDEVMVICARITAPLMMADNETGRCCACGWRVQFRPHAPPGRRMCMECAVALVEDGAEVILPLRMVEDALDYFRKKLQ